MNFMGDMQDTIFALSSGAGVAAVAVVRLSGPHAGAALRQLTKRALPDPRKLALRRLQDPADGALIDEALVAWLPAPSTFTGEDMVELHVHGSRAVLQHLLDVLGGMQGLRAAQRGEFTRRALLAGRMSLPQVEALADLLAAETRAQQQLALTGLSGAGTQQAEAWRKALVDILARLEAAIDFIDEEDVAEQALTGVPEAISALVVEMTTALEKGRGAERLREGVRVVIAGPPNAGKSSLLNWLAGREVAIVSDIPGTTRDVLEVKLDLDGIPVLVSDTAGLRAASDDAIERLGMERAQALLQDADIILLMHAPDVPPPSISVFTDSSALVLKVFNKADLSPSIPSRNEFDAIISIRDESGLDSLLERLRREVKQRFGQGETALFVQARQQQALRAARDALAMVPQDEQTFLAQPAELLAEHVRTATRHLEELIGRVDVENLLDEIFSTFCIGK